MSLKNEEVKTLLAATVAHILWGFSFLAARTALNFANVFTLLSHRFVLAFAVMSVIALLRPGSLQLRGRRVLLLVLLGISEPVAYFIGEQYGLLHSTTIFSGVMIALIPIAATLAAAPILKERPTVGQLLFGVLSVCGVIGIGLLSNQAGALDWIGVAGLSVAVLSAVVYTLLSRHISKEFNAFTRTYMMMAVGAAAFTVLSLIQSHGSLTSYAAPLTNPEYLWSMLFLALGCSLICYFLLSYAITRLSVARETVFANLTTAVSVVVGAVLLHEPFSWKEAALCVLILLGIFGVQWCAKRTK